MDLFPKDQVEFILKDRDSESALIKRRVYLAGLFILLFITLLLSRVFFLTVLQNDHYTTKAKENRQKILPIAPIRGLIYSDSGAILAENKPTYSLQVIPEKIPDIDQLIRELRKIIHIGDEDVEQFKKLSGKKRRFERLPLRTDLNENEVALFSVNRHLFSSIDVVEGFNRHYPQGEEFVHSIGYVARIDENDLKNISKLGKDSNYSATTHIGKLGIEESYESYLHGEVGYQKVEVNAAGRVIRVLERESPKPGKNLYLTINLSLQRIATESLNGRRGAVVAIDPRDGKILTFVSSPTYNPNDFASGIDKQSYKALISSKDRPLVNRVIQGKYPPGSTIKPFLALIALEGEMRNTKEEVWCPGWFSLPDHEHRYRDWKKEGHGHTNLDKAIVQSCDVFFYNLAHELGIDHIFAGLSRFGFGQASGIDIIGEKIGLLPSRKWKRNNLNEAWFPGETVILGIGQGYALTTPMQLVRATAAIANRGLLIEPRLVLGTNSSGEKGLSFNLDSPRHKISLKNNVFWDKVISSMKSVVHRAGGTAWRSGLNAEYYFAGKTGTAQIIGIDQEGEYKEEEIPDELKDHALFIAFAPVKSPEIALAIIVENGGSGSKAAAPIARKILDEFFMNKDLISKE